MAAWNAELEIRAYSHREITWILTDMAEFASAVSFKVENLTSVWKRVDPELPSVSGWNKKKELVWFGRDELWLDTCKSHLCKCTADQPTSVEGYVMTISVLSEYEQSERNTKYFLHRSTQNFTIFAYIRGPLNRFPDFFRIGTFIDSTHMKL